MPEETKQELETPEEQIRKLANKLALAQSILEEAYTPEATRQILCKAISDTLDIICPEYDSSRPTDGIIEEQLYDLYDENEILSEKLDAICDVIRAGKGLAPLTKRKRRRQ